MEAGVTSDQELTIAEVEQYVQAHGNWYQHQSPESLEVRLARALLASQKALRDGCEGCQSYLLTVVNEHTGGHWHPFGAEFLICNLTDEQRAALLTLGEGENGG